MHYACLEMQNVESGEENLYTDVYFNVKPEAILRTSYDQLTVDCKNEGILGSCTALVAILRVILDSQAIHKRMTNCGWQTWAIVDYW